MHHVLRGVARDGCLELARQVGQLRIANEPRADLLDQGGRIDDLVLGNAGHRRSQNDAGHVTARLGGGQAGSFEPVPNLRHVLNAHPVQLDVLPVRQVSSIAAKVGGNLPNDAQLLGGQGPAVDADAEHEVLVFEFVRLQGGGLAAVDPLLALGVQPPPAKTAVQIGFFDAVEPAGGVDGLNPFTDAQPAVFLLPDLVRVQRRRAVNLPLAVRFRRGPGTYGTRRHCFGCGGRLCGRSG